jgi:CRP/FNR family cyclic AMP-dependent transcriptional regulator
MSAELDQLGQYEIFRGVPRDALGHLAARLRRRTVAPGTNLIIAEQPGEVVYVLVEGTIKILVEQLDGREVILAVLGPGDTVGEMSLVDSAGRSANVMTLERCTFLCLDKSTFQEALGSVPEFTRNLVRLLASRLRLANAQIQALSTLDVAGRLARQLLAFAERYGRTADGAPGGVRIGLRLTQADLADLVGASRERVNQVMRELRERGLISVDRARRIQVHEREALARLCR